jgi:hypothetical protein
VYTFGVYYVYALRSGTECVCTVRKPVRVYHAGNLDQAREDMKAVVDAMLEEVVVFIRNLPSSRVVYDR